MSTYDLSDGRSVYYDDGKQSLQDAADLYAVLPEQTDGGSPNLENLKARHLLDRCQTGLGLSEHHIGELQQLMAKHQNAIDAYRRRGRDGQDPLAMASGGSDSRITQEAERVRFTTSTELRLSPGSVKLREDLGERDGAFLAHVFGERPVDVTPAEKPRDAVPLPGRQQTIREAVAAGALDLDDASRTDFDARTWNQDHEVDMLTAVGIEPGPLRESGEPASGDDLLQRIGIEP